MLLSRDTLSQTLAGGIALIAFGERQRCRTFNPASVSLRPKWGYNGCHKEYLLILPYRLSPDAHLFNLGSSESRLSVDDRPWLAWFELAELTDDLGRIIQYGPLLS